MAKSKTPWTTISVRPLAGMLDTRSRPADLPPGSFRYKQNLQISTEGILSRCPGFQRFYADKLYDVNGVPLTEPGDHVGIYYHNADHHHQGATREPITFQFESTDSSGVRRYFDGTQSRVSLLNESTGYYTDIITGKGAAGSRWKGAELQDQVALTNNVDDVQFYDIGSATVSTSGDLTSADPHTRKAKLVIEWNGVLFLMNTFQDNDNARHSSRVRWSDLNLPLSWSVGGANSIAGVQDLDYGDEILNAGFLLGNLYIFCRSSIWRVTLGKATIGVSGVGVFDFLKVYSEPRNQTGCLAFPNTLISDGRNFRYLGRDSLYKFNPYLPAPESEDWSHRASGAIFTKADTALTGTNCDAPVAKYRPALKEYWVSWPSGNAALNTITMVFQTQQATADIRDHGFTSFLNYRKTPVATLCNEALSFLGVSATDWAIKDIGTVFYREMVVLTGGQTDDPPLNSLPAEYVHLGYNSIMRGLIPAGFTDRQKDIRFVVVDHETSEEDVPCVIRCRIGNSQNLRDVNDNDNVAAVFWRDLGTKPLASQDGGTVSAMQAQNLRPDGTTNFPCFETGIFLYFEFIIENADGTPAIGADTAFQRLDFDLRGYPKP